MKTTVNSQARTALAALFFMGSLALLAIACYDGIRFWSLRQNGHLETLVVERVQVVKSTSPKLRPNIHQQMGSENVLTLIVPREPIVKSVPVDEDRGIDGFLKDLDGSIKDLNKPLPPGRRIIISRISDELVENLFAGKEIEGLVQDEVSDLALIGKQIKIGFGEWILQPIILIGLGLALLGVLILGFWRTKKSAR